MRFKDRVSAAPAEPDGADFVGPWSHTDSVDEAIDDRLRNSLAVLDEPRPQSSRNENGVLGFVGHA